jgi:hypothetical protein
VQVSRLSKSEPDAAFIAHAREDIPRLLADLDEAEAENERLRAQALTLVTANAELAEEFTRRSDPKP